MTAVTILRCFVNDARADGRVRRYLELLPQVIAWVRNASVILR